jgi:hypothetical protein
MIPQSVAEILAHRVKLAVEGIDRMYLNVYVPRLQTEQGIVWFFREHRGQPLPSAALMSPMSGRFVTALEAFAAKHGLPLVQFHKGPRKDDVMAERLREFDRRGGVHRQGAGEDASIPHREAQEPEDRSALSLDRALDRHGDEISRYCPPPPIVARPGLAQRGGPK